MTRGHNTYAALLQSNTENGEPVRAEKLGMNDQPPSTSCTARLELLNGTSQMAARMKRWRTSNSALPLSRPGFRGSRRPRFPEPVAASLKVLLMLSMACDQV